MPVWLDRLSHYESIGFKRVPGPGSNDHILKWAHGAGQAAWVTDDDTPWCGIGLAGIMDECGLGHVIPKDPAKALSWATCGVECEPKVGAIVVFPRTGGHHVTVIKQIDGDTWYCLGCNQSNAIKTSPFKAADALAVRWPVKAMAKSRIAQAAERQQTDTACASVTGTPTAAVPETHVPNLRETVGSWFEQASWFRGVAEGAGDFMTFALSNWRIVLGAVTVFFVLRILWDSAAIRRWRHEDHENGRTR